jgi:beta-N-acetylhexosaminidase
MRLAALLALLAALAIAGQPVAQPDSVQARLDRMTLEQKVAQIFVASAYGAPLNEPTLAFLERYQPGAFVLLPSNIGSPARTAAVVAQAQAALEAAGAPPMFIAVDQEGGIVAHLKDGFTTWPVPALLAATGDVNLAYQTGQAVGREMRAVGVTVNLAPVVDLNTNPANPIIGRRAFGQNPAIVAPIVAAYARGLQSMGVAAVAKHFPGHGASDTDSHHEIPVIDRDRTTLEAEELLPFRAMIDADVAAIMVGHLNLPALGMPAGQPASLASDIIDGLLRGELGFDGIVITDALDMDAIDTRYSPAAAAVAAVKAGNDMVILGAHVGLETQAQAIEAVVAAVHAGELAPERIDRSVQRILTAKARFGLLESAPETTPGTLPQLVAAHEELVQALFAGGVTLLQDRNDLADASLSTAFVFPGTQTGMWERCQPVHANWTPYAVSERPEPVEVQALQALATRHERIVLVTRDPAPSDAWLALVAVLPPERVIVAGPQVGGIGGVSTLINTFSPLPQGDAVLCGLLMGRLSFTGRWP